MRNVWASDGPISMPVAPSVPVLVDFDGFGFTYQGIVHNVTTGDLEALALPLFAPEGANFDETSMRLT